MTDRGHDSTLSEEMALKLGKLGARPLHGRVFFDSWEVADDIGCLRASRILCYVGVKIVNAFIYRQQNEQN